MSSIQSLILGLLDKSSLPGLYKSIIQNLLPDMSRIQQEELLATLANEDAEKQVLHTQMTQTYHRYNSALDRIEKDPHEFDKIYDFFPELKNVDPAEAKDASKAGASGNQKVASTKELSKLKMKVDLGKLKK